MDRKVFEQLCSLATDLSPEDRSSFYELLTPTTQAELRSVVERSGQIGDTPEVAQALPSAVPSDDATEVFDAQEFVASGGLPTVEGYQITEELARGGMGVVYRAQNVTLNREVALKLMQEGQLARPQERLRFEREARSAAKLSHRNIVTIFEYGYADGLAFLAMEFVHGPTLQNVISKEPLQAVEAATILKDVAQAIGYAHDNGIVHRDLKPANILLQEGTTPRVTDFGLARGDSDQQLTATEAIMGTPSYMAPEQAAGRMAEVGRGSERNAEKAKNVIDRLATNLPYRSAEIPKLKVEVQESYDRLLEAIQVNKQLWAEVVSPSAVPSADDIARMKEVVRDFPLGIYFNTLGVVQYRAGDFEAAIAACLKSVDLTPAQESRYDSPFAGDYAFLAMSHFQLGNTEKANKYRELLIEAMKLESYKDDEVCIGFAREVDDLLGKAEAVEPPDVR